MALIDLTNQKFERLKAVSVKSKNPRGVTLWECKCDCGNTVFVASSNLRRGKTKSCGCLKNKHKIVAGDRFGKLVVLEKVGNRHRNALFVCACDCGNQTEVLKGNLVKGATKSCGCSMSRYKKTHGMTDSPTHNSWENMIARCTNPKNPAWERYGGRGITVDPGWRLFKNFFADMGERPEGKTLERIDNNKGYCAENCKWATRHEQQSNMSSNRFITFAGETNTLSQWSRKTGIPITTLLGRIDDRNWTVEKALTTPVKGLNS